MQETPQQYTQRILGYLEGKEPMAVLAATPPACTPGQGRSEEETVTAPRTGQVVRHGDPGSPC